MEVLRQFFKLQSTAGIILMLAVVVSLILSNTFLNQYYLDFLSTEFAIIFGQFKLSKPLLLWINDGLMAIFFLLIGLELKREFVVGHLSNPANLTLPVIGAVGGLVFPALIFYFFNQDNSIALRGWAIPAATDIAFALGVMALLSDSVPKSAKIFLLTLAIFDDLAAIIIIAIFYTDNISFTAGLLSFLGIALLFLLNKQNVRSLIPYLLVGLFLWLCVLKSGVHATLAGVVCALFIPIDKHEKKSPLHILEHALHPWVTFMILPIFAIANSGVEIAPMLENDIFNGITLGACFGLLFGKQFGVFFTCYIAIILFKVNLQKEIGLVGLYGVSLLTGIGFTMSLFIASLAYGEAHYDYMMNARLGIICGSVLSAILGYLLLRYAWKPKH